MSETPLDISPASPPEKTAGGAIPEIMGIVSFASGLLALLLGIILTAQIFINDELFSATELAPNQYWIAYLFVIAAGLPFVGLATGIGTLFQPPRHKVFAISGIALNAFLLIGACCVFTLAVMGGA